MSEGKQHRQTPEISNTVLVRLIDETASVTDEYHVIIPDIPNHDHDEIFQANDTSVVATVDSFTQSTPEEPWTRDERLQDHSISLDGEHLSLRLGVSFV